MATAPEKADLVLHEGRVFGFPESDSLAVRAGRILGHGKFAELKTLVGPRTHLIKLQGRTLAPGFIDSHLHFLEAAAVSTGLSVWRCRTIGDLLAALRVGADKTPPGNWLRAFGCDEALLAERRGPTREELDRTVPKNPLRLRHSTLHASWLNSRAIAALGLEAPDFHAPEGGVAVMDASGRASGLVIGMEQWITSKLPLVTAAEIEARARILSRELCASGVTAFTDVSASNGSSQLELFAKLLASRVICQRMSVLIGSAHLDLAARVSEIARRAGPKIAGVKFFPAGCDAGALACEVGFALANRMDCAFHVTEVEELEIALSAVERALQDTEANGGGPIIRLEHGGCIPPNYLGRISALRAWVVSNPGFIYYRGAKYAAEPGLVPYLYRLKSLKNASIPLAGGTDAPVTPAKPLAAIAAAMSRHSLEGYQLGPEEKLEAPGAFALFTADAARLARLPAGAIEAGMLADLVVFQTDPLKLAPAELMNVAVDMTLIGGRTVYERGRPAVAYSASADLLSNS